MARNSGNKKKVVITTKTANRVSVSPSIATRQSFRSGEQMLFGKSNYLWIGIGVLLIVLGMFLMAGGKQAPDAWVESEIYGFRRTVLAPIVILMGLGIQFFAIFKKSDA